MPTNQTPLSGSPADGHWPGVDRAGWAVALDALALAGTVAAAATAERQLRDEVAAALCGRFADWVFVDLTGAGGDARSVASSSRDRRLSALLAGQLAGSCPVIPAAIRRRTPVVRVAPADPAELGKLADGRNILQLVSARSYAVSPLVTGRGACGAISVIRGPGLPVISFLDLGVLSQIADVVAAAVSRLRRGRAAPQPGPGTVSPAR
jgi:GAF domain-containing protein